MTPDQFSTLIVDAADKWAKVIKFAGINRVSDRGASCVYRFNSK